MLEGPSQPHRDPTTGRNQARLRALMTPRPRLRGHGGRPRRSSTTRIPLEALVGASRLLLGGVAAERMRSVIYPTAVPTKPPQWTTGAGGRRPALRRTLIYITHTEIESRIQTTDEKRRRHMIS